MKLAAIQLNPGSDFELNVRKAFSLVTQARQQGAGIVALPENFSFLRTSGQVPLVAHALESDFVRRLQRLAADLEIYLLAGSFHEQLAGSAKLFNTSLLLGPAGEVLGVYRKIHLFDICLPGGPQFQESARFAAGADFVVCSTPAGRFGLSICYDLRFPELYRALAERGAEVLCIPSAFTTATGREHWEVLVRCRAIENLSYVVAPALSGSPSPKIHNYGHSLIVDPWGQILASAGDLDEGVILAELDLDALRTRREQLPALQHRRISIPALK